MNKKILIIGLIWPEPNTTAAGTRMMQLVHFLLSRKFDVNFASTAAKSEQSYDLEKLNINCFSIELNHSSFDSRIKELDPEIVLFDRFLTEEQFGWRVKENCPNAVRILDTEDLHFLRKSRELALKANDPNWQNYIQNDITKREIASIYRCDLSLIISKYEVSLLENYFSISSSLLFYFPIFDQSYTNISLENYHPYEERQHFMTIGNFKHKPNIDAVRHLRKRIWPLIRNKLPKSEMHVYGAYPSEAVKQLESKKEGFFIKGWISNKKDAFVNYRICLAPLRFGAGQKGKLLDAMYFGTPSITTSIGAEGLSDLENWNGF
ncbi:MAG: glycosyltransferase, partial [Methylococcales bacterium]|nr:glycosyltransferase [Methylococcales bacterium]